MGDFYSELKRRNVVRVGIAYAVGGGLMIELIDTIAPRLGMPDWVPTFIIVVVLIGLPIALFFSWSYEFTSQGLKKTHEVDAAASLTHSSGRRLDFAIIGMLVLALGYFVWDKFGAEPTLESAGLRSIAVLPFVNISNDPEQEYFSDGISEELLNVLAKVEGLRVISRSSSFSFKGKDFDIPTIAEQLNVTHILEGSVRKVGNQVRITAQLIEAGSDSRLWSETYDRTLDDIFATQDEIAAKVVEQLKITLLGDALTVRATEPGAYALYLQGKYFSNLRGNENLARAEAAYKSALDIDPGYAPAWAGLADSYRHQANSLFRDFDIGMELAREATELALSIDDRLASAWASQCYTQGYYDWDWVAAEISCNKALKLEPGNPDVVNGAVVIPVMLGQLDKAIALLETAIRLDPLGFSQRNRIGHAYVMTGQLDLAEGSFRRVLDLNPENQRARANLAEVLLLQGQPEKALVEIDLVRGGSWRQFTRALILSSLGRAEEAEGFVEAFFEEHGPSGYYKIAQYHAWRGDADAAFEALEHALEVPLKVLAFILSAPILIRLNDDPRWPAFLDKIGLRDAWEVMPPEYGGPSS